MLKRFQPCIALPLITVLAGCSGNYKFDVDKYRPMGKPAEQAPEKDA